MSSREVVCVVGMVRSGTSLMTGSLRSLGVNLGNRLLQPTPDNPMGFFEDEVLLDLDEQLLAHRFATPRAEPARARRAAGGP